MDRKTEEDGLGLLQKLTTGDDANVPSDMGTPRSYRYQLSTYRKL